MPFSVSGFNLVWNQGLFCMDSVLCPNVVEAHLGEYVFGFENSFEDKLDVRVCPIYII